MFSIGVWPVDQVPLTDYRDFILNTSLWYIYLTAVQHWDLCKVISFIRKIILFQFCIKSSDNHVGARHCRKPLCRRKGWNISITVDQKRALIKISETRYKSWLEYSVVITKSRAFLTNHGWNVSSTVGMTKSRALQTNLG